MANAIEQQNVFRQGKLLDPRDKAASVFMQSQGVNGTAEVFLGTAPVHQSAGVFISGQIPMHDSARDFLEDNG